MTRTRHVFPRTASILGFVLVVVVLVAGSSSRARAVARRHIAWDGMVRGTGLSKIKGLVGMVGGTVAGTTAVDIKFSGDIAGSRRPWHIHRGSCAKGGPIFGDAGAYTLLQVNAAGTTEGRATLRVSLPDSGYFYVNVHESVAKMGTVVACGDLLLEE
jgi:Cu-Zn family superoxide dismutase